RVLADEGLWFGGCANATPPGREHGDKGRQPKWSGHGDPPPSLRSQGRACGLFGCGTTLCKKIRGPQPQTINQFAAVVYRKLAKLFVRRTCQAPVSLVRLKEKL